MKTIEEKARAYDKVRKKIAIRFGSNVADEFFAEFEESEDEKARKAIMALIEWSKSYSASGITNDDAKKMLAWLERQGEKLPAGFYYVNSEGKKFYSEKFKYGNVVLGISANNGKDEQKPEENKGNIGGISSNWSEEYEAVLDALIRKFEGENIYMSPHLAVKCLKSLKGRVQPKQEWNEEEIEKAAQEWDSKANFNPFYMTMDGDKPTGVLQDITTHKESFKAGVNWILKSLKPHNHWKPSDEQMEILLQAVAYFGVSWVSEDYLALQSLYFDLKKLKEGKV